MLLALAGIVVRAPHRVLAGAVVLAVVAAVFGSSTPGRLSSSDDDFQNPSSESFRTSRVLGEAEGHVSTPGLVVLAPAHGPVRRVVAELRRDPSLARVVPEAGVSRDGKLVATAAYFLPDVRAGDAAARIASRLDRLPGVLVGGSALANKQVNREVERDLVRAEAIAFPLLLLLAFWIFRSLVAAIVPLLAGGLTLVVTLLVLRLVNAAHPLSVYALNLVTGAALGLAIDYSLLLVSRYREEMARAGPGNGAVRATVATAGRTVAFSAATVAAAFASLLVFPLNFLRSMAIGGLIVAPLAGLVALVLLPALFTVLGRRIDALAPARWQRAAERTARPDEQGGWYRLAAFVMRYPAPVAVCATALLVVLGLPALGIRFTGIDARMLPVSASSRQVEELLAAEFPPGLRNAAVVAVRGDAAAARRVAGEVRGLDGVALAAPPTRVRQGLWQQNVYPSGQVFSGSAKRLIRAIRGLPEPLAVTGRTAWYLDTSATLLRRLPWALALLCATTYVLLFFATRSVILPLKALVMNVLTLSAAFGLLVLVFQHGRLEWLLRYRGEGALELTQPILLFAVAFGLCTDYGVFLLTRIREGWDAGLSNRDAVVLGVERTGRIVTAAALLFCVAIGAFATSRLAFVKELGIGIAAAVAIDASIVRAFLVPSLMALLGRWNWWAPRPLRRRLPRRRAAA
jgi:RND superfamily putative drug exporter